MNYRVVFDLAQEGYRNWPFVARFALGVVVGLGLMAFRKQLPGWWGKHPRASSAFAFISFGFSLFLLLAVFITTFLGYTHLKNALLNGQAKVVEGPVSQFVPMPFSGHSKERFCVRETCFEYSDFVITPGFNNTASHGGPIRETLPVRVTFVGRTIVRLEVAE
jgi:hypothetical protein